MRLEMGTRVSQAFGALTVTAAAYLTFLTAQYFFPPHLPRRRLESVFFVLIALGAVSVLTRQAAGRSKPQGSRPLSIVKAVLVFAILAASIWVIYRPATGIGLLSDDFIVADFARRHQWRYGVDLARARPLVPMLWAALDHAPFAFDRAIHATNITLHTVNALLVTMVAARMGIPRLHALAAGLLFAVSPGLTESVVWATGVHDVLMTTFVLLAVVAATLADRGWPWQLGAVAATVLALGAKETGVVAPLLAAAVVWASGSPLIRGRTAQTLALMLGVALVYGVWRAASGVPAEYGEDVFRVYFVKQLLVGPFAAIGAPWTMGWAAAHPGRAFVRSAALIAITTLALLAWRVNSPSLRHAAAAALWTLAGILPVFSFFYVGPSLEGSRYVYLSSAGFALLVSALAGTTAGMFPWALRAPAFMAMMLVVALPIVPALGSELSRWREAARIRDAILARAASEPAVRQCESFSPSGLADNVDGAFVFHNGLVQAIGGLSGGGGHCRIAWDGTDLTVSRD